MAKNLVFGKWGETQAASFLEDEGVEIIGRNIRTAYGEIDLVGRLPGTCIFIEVKTRSSNDFGMPEDAVTKNKLIHIFQSAQAYLVDHPELGENWRIDVIAVQKYKNRSAPIITWFENVSLE